MTKNNYQKLLSTRYNNLLKDNLPSASILDLEELLSMPHPQREAAFVSWAAVPNRADHHRHKMTTEVCINIGQPHGFNNGSFFSLLN